jgi:hypothetical protein
MIGRNPFHILKRGDSPEIYMKKITSTVIGCCLFIFCQAQSKKPSDVITKVVMNYNDTLKMHFINNASLYSEGWDSLGNTRLWRQVMCMSKDSCVLNIASHRKPLLTMSHNDWMNHSEQEKDNFKDSICKSFNLAPGTDLFVTNGKEEFFELRKVIPEISKAIDVFKANNCDPWYAQTILLIESPGRVKAKSSAGAKGPFQLMKAVARKYGLRTTRKGDDRTNLEKSARVAALLLKSSCIPYVKSYLDGYHLSYHEDDLWFRLLVLHAYNAGAGNVKCVLDAINPKEGGIALFQKIWTTTCGHFKNESQNYSQIALASLLRFDEILNQDGDTVFLVQGDKYWKRYKRNKSNLNQSSDYLNTCVLNYENDLVDGTLPYDYFCKRVNRVRKEMTALTDRPGKHNKTKIRTTIGIYPATEDHIDSLASRLLHKQRYDDAIALLKLNMDMHPRSAATYESLANAYNQAGKPRLASVYANKSTVMTRAMENKGE